MRIPVEFGNRAVISDDVQVDWGDEAIIEKLGQVCLDIKWMLAGQADEVGVALDPDIRSFRVIRMDLQEFRGIATVSGKRKRQCITEEMTILRNLRDNET